MLEGRRAIGRVVGRLGRAGLTPGGFQSPRRRRLDGGGDEDGDEEEAVVVVGEGEGGVGDEVAVDEAGEAAEVGEVGEGDEGEGGEVVAVVRRRPNGNVWSNLCVLVGVANVW